MGLARQRLNTADTVRADILRHCGEPDLVTAKTGQTRIPRTRPDALDYLTVKLMHVACAFISIADFALRGDRNFLSVLTAQNWRLRLEFGW